MEKKRKKERKFAGKAKCIGAAGLAGWLLLGVSIQADAATLKDVFDEHYYADRYEDLKAAYGYDRDALWTHFMTLGISEGRNMNGLLDVAKYRREYPDLSEVFGDNWDAYLEHYLTVGAKEGRDSGTEFNALHYAGRYEDLQRAYGDDILALWQHYSTVGAAEGRDARDERIRAAEESRQSQGAQENGTLQDSQGTQESGTSQDSQNPTAGDVSVDIGPVAVGASAQESECAYGVLAIMNQIRAENGLSALSVTQQLMNTAQLRAKELSDAFSHTRPDGTSCFTAYEQNGVSYMAAGENIAYGYGTLYTPESVMDAWMNSPGHRANILDGSYNHVGIGCFMRSDGYVFWSQNFTD